MAASDYAYIAFNTEGNSVKDSENFGRFSIEPYKTWLYIHSPEIWKDHEGYIKDTVGQIEEGNLNFFGVSIFIENIDLINKDGIPYSTVKLFYCKKGYDSKETKAQHFGGILCYAYLDIERKIAKDLGIPESCVIGGGSNCNKDGTYTKILWGYDPNKVYKNGESFEIALPEQYQNEDNFHYYCGITNDMLNAFLSWDVPDKEWLNKIKNNKNKKYHNQGNLVFGADEGDNIGENKGVILQEILKNYE